MDRPLVLVVHPQEGIRALMTRMLTSFGYAVETTSSGEEALDRLASGSAAVVLLDLDLPGMSGLETLRALRALAPAPEVVVTTHGGTVDAATEAARHGAFDVVAQPFDFRSHLGHCRCRVVHRLDCEFDTERPFDRDKQFDSFQGIPAKKKKVVIRPHAIRPEHLLPKVPNGLLCGGHRRNRRRVKLSALGACDLFAF